MLVEKVPYNTANDIVDRRRNWKTHSACSRVGKGGWGVITECVRNEMLESRRETYTGRQGNAVVEIPELAEQQ